MVTEIPAEADSVMLRLLALLGVTPIQNGQIVFDIADRLIAGVRPQPVYRFRREKPVARDGRQSHTQHR